MYYKGIFSLIFTSFRKFQHIYIEFIEFHIVSPDFTRVGKCYVLKQKGNTETTFSRKVTFDIKKLFAAGS